MISVIVPVRNEDTRNLSELRARLTSVLDHLTPSWELLFVDDDSDEATRALLRRFAQDDARIRLLCLERRVGQETALVTGLLAADGDVLCTMDSDLEHHPEELPRLLAPLQDGCDLVLGRRRAGGDYPLRRRLITRAYSTFMNVRWRTHLGDWGCSFNAGRRDVFDALRERLATWRGGPLKLACLQRAARWVEVDVTQDIRRYGRSGYRGGHFLWHAIRMVVSGTTLQPPRPAAHPVQGPGRVLLEEDDDLTQGTSWSTVGYTVEPFLSPETSGALRAGLERLVFDLLKRFQVALDSHPSLERYHVYVGGHEGLHERIVRRLNKLPLWRLPVDPAVIAARVSEICGVAVTTENPYFGPLAPLASPFGLRIVRPGSTDHNPPHRDVWLRRLRNGVNIYVPLAGSTARSSLCLVPGSHRWREDEIERTPAGAVVNGRRYTVPTVTEATRPLMFVRPNPGENEVLVFSPYLIHGGASNLTADRTRLSLEMRFWRRPAGRSLRQ